MSDSQPTIRTRFAPSPTGFVHIGNFRTALFGFLFARHGKGVNVLRVEDTDQTRKVEGAIENMLAVMDTLKVSFDEGPALVDGKIVEKGDLGPYTQSERLDIYKEHAQKLLDAGKAYYCFCSSQRLEEVRKEQTALKKPPMYDRHCRNLEKSEVEAQLKTFESEGKQPVIRMAIPEKGTTVIHDLVFGEITYDHAVLDDQVLMKSDGYPTYHLAVVVDDHFMQITHVIRGDDWIPSTPKHILLYQAFGWEAPEFAHLPLILNPDKTKLSKRQGDVAVEEFLQKGYLSETLVNFVALLGWNPKTEQEIFSIEDLISQFDIAKVNKAGAVLDHAKLDWMNAHYIKNKSNADLVELCRPYWKQVDIDVNSFENDYLEAVMALEKDRLKKLSDIVEHEFYFKDPTVTAEKLVWKKSTPEATKAIFIKLTDFFENLKEEDFTLEKLEVALKKFILDNIYDNGSVLWPLRVALTGLDKSPGPFEVASTLYVGWGRAGIIKRIKTAANLL